MSRFGLPTTRRTLTYWSESHRGPSKWSEDGAHSIKAETDRDVLIQPGEEKAWRNFTVVNIYLMGGYIGDKAKLFSEVCSSEMRASVLKLECKSFWLAIRKIFSL